MVRQTVVLLVALLFGLAAFVWIEGFSPSFQTCVGSLQANSIVNDFSSYARCTANFADTHNALITALATVLLAVITLGLVWGAAEQQKTTRAQLRAYVATAESEIDDVTRVGNLNITIRIKNTGQTPANQISIWVGTVSRQFPPAEHDFPTITVPQAKNMSLGPGEAHTVAICHRNWPGKQFPANEALYVYGHIEYRDCFNRHQQTRFRLFKGGSVGVLGGDLYFADGGNTAT